MFSKIKNLQRRKSGAYFAMFHVPVVLQKVVSKKQVWKSLQTTQREIAIEKIISISKKTSYLFESLMEARIEGTMSDEQIKNIFINHFVKVFKQQQKFLREKEFEVDKCKAEQIQAKNDFYEYELETEEDFNILDSKEREYEGIIHYLKKKKDKLFMANKSLKISSIPLLQQKIAKQIKVGEFIQEKKMIKILEREHHYLSNEKKENIDANRIYANVFCKFLELNKSPETMTNMLVEFFKKAMNDFNLSNFEKKISSTLLFEDMANRWVESYLNELDSTIEYKKKQKMNIRVISDIFKDFNFVQADIIQVEKRLKILSNMPRGMKKTYKNLSIKEIEEKHPDYKKISYTTFITYLRTFKAILKEAYRTGAIKEDLVYKIKPPNKKEAKMKRETFNTQDLNKLFNDDFFLSKSEKKDFWLPVISLYTGMRLTEICQLLVEDIKKEKGIFYIHLEESNEANKIKKLKTSSSARKIPIHKKLIDLGFLEYVEKIKKSKSIRLFPNLMTKGKLRSDLASKRFYTVLVKAGIKKVGLCFHSLRHTFRDIGRNSDVDHKKMEQLGGWKNDKSLADYYGDGFSLEKLNEAIQKIEYNGLDFTGIVEKLKQ